MIETICRIEDKIEIDGKDYFKLTESQTKNDYLVPLNQLFNDNLFIGSEYKFYKQYNSKFEKYFLIQEHPFYKLNNTYEFKIIRKEHREEDGTIDAFIIRDSNDYEIKVKAFNWQSEKWEKETLACQIIGYSKRGLVLRNSDFSNLPYKIGVIYEFKLLGFGEFENNKSQTIPSVILEIQDGSQVNVTALKWQTENLWKFNTVFCEVLKYNSLGRPYLKNKDERHPIFEVGKTYDFKVKRLKTKLDLKNGNKKYDIIELLGQDGCIHEANALPGQMRTIQEDDNVQCIIQSIGFNLRLNQTNIKDPYFSRIEDIVKDKELITKYFEKAISDKEDEDSIVLAAKYESNSAFWVFTFCNKLLTRYFKSYSERYDYKSSKQIAQLIIILENWIIKNGIISSFPDEKARKNTLLKAKQQLEKYSRIKEILTVLEKLNLTDFFTRKRDKITNSEIDELYYILLFSDINQIDENLFLNYLKEILASISLSAQINFSLVQLDKAIQINKNYYYNNEYEKTFNLSFKNNNLFESELYKSKYFSWSFCQYLINEKLQNFERANYLLGKILRQYFYSYTNIDLKERLLFNAYYFQNNQKQINVHPFEYNNQLLLVEEKLHSNPNCCKSQDKTWSKIKDSFDNENYIVANITQKQFNGFVLDFEGIKGFLPFNHISDNTLKYYSHSKIDFTVSIQCILISEEFNFYVARQPKSNSEDIVCINNLLGNVKIGDIIEGKVKSIANYGLFISSYFGDGLIHRTNISTHPWDCDKLTQYFKIGERITAKIIDIVNGKIELSLRALINTSEEDKYFDFLNYVEFGDMFSKEHEEISFSDDIINDINEIKFNQLEKAFCFEQFAMLKKNPDEKIHYLRLSKQFFSSINNPRSYLINIYTNYFELLKLIDDAIHSFSFEKIDKIKIEAQKILEKVKSQQQTLEVYPDAKKLIFFINILSLFNDTTEEGINILYELLRKNTDTKILKTISKITLANNLLTSESQENAEFVRKNLRHIKSYLDEGVLSLKETESDKRERELRDKVKYWSGRINEDESETQEFKSTFKTPVPDEKSIAEKSKLLSVLGTTQKKDGILRKLDLIDGDLASKIVIHSSLKTLCAFANTNGGTLLIGVSDSKFIVGLEVDYANLKNKKNRDGFGLFFDDKIKEYFEPSFSSLLERDFIKFPEGDILIVNVKQSVEPIFLLKDKEGKPCEELYVRDLTSTKEIKEKRELVKFVKQKEKEQIKIKIDK